MIAVLFMVCWFFCLLIGVLLIFVFSCENKTPSRPRVEYSLTARELQEAIDVALQYAEKDIDALEPGLLALHLNCLLMVQRARAKEIYLSPEKRECGL